MPTPQDVQARPWDYADKTSLLGNLSSAYSSVNPSIPYVTPAIENYVKPYVSTAANVATAPVTGGYNLARLASNALGGPSLPNPGDIIASGVPSHAADIALTAAPFAGEIGRGAGVLAERAGALAENPALREAVVGGEAGGVRLPFGEKPPVEPPTTPIGKLTAAIEGAEKATPEQQAMFAAQKAQQTARGAGALEQGIAQGQGRQAFQQAREAMAGEFQRPSFTVPDFTTEDAQSLYQQIGGADNVRFYDKVNAESALTDLLGGRIPQPAQLTALRKVFPEEADALFKAVRGKQGFDLWREIKGIAGIPQALQSSYDVSAALRQGAILGWSNPREWAASWEPMINSMRSEEAARAAVQRVESSPWYSRPDGLGFSDVGGHVYNEEAFNQGTERAGGFAGLNDSVASRWVQAIPGIRQSERGFSAFLNEEGMKVYEKVAQGMHDAGVVDPKQYEAVAKVINHARGYGDFNVGQVGQGLNALYSGRNFVARFQVLTDPLTQIRNPAARSLAVKNLVGMIGGNLSLLGMLAAAGTATGAWSVNFDPRSSDWGKVKIGNTRIDPWGGFGPMVRLAARVATGETMTQSGAIRPTQASTEILRFLQNKESPAANIIASHFLGQQNIGGQPGVNLQTAKNLFVPFVMQDLADGIKNSGMLTGAVAGAGSAVGLGANSYPPPTAEQRDTAAQQMGLPDYASATSAQKKEINDNLGIQRQPFYTATAQTVDDADRFLKDAARQGYGHGVTYKNFRRDINEDSHSLQAWNDSKDMFTREEAWTQANQDPAALALYKKPFDQLTQAEQNRVTGELHVKAREDNPTLDAYLAYFRGEQDVRSTAAGNIFSQLNKKYKGTDTVKLAQGAK